MARGDDFAPLFTLGGPLGWAVGVFSVFKKVFGGSKQAERDKLFKQHRERNEARGWKPGDNVFNAATQAAEIEARRSAAERAIQQVDTLLSKVPEAPWLARKALGKSGRLYRLRDVRENVVRNNRAINDAKIKAQEKEARARQIARDRGIRDSGVARSRAGGSSAGTFQGQLAGVIVQDWLGRQLDADAARQRLSRATNRRGALTQRAVRTRTNRRGGLTQFARPKSPVSSRPVSASGARVPAPEKPGIEPELTAPRPVEQQSESARSREARRIMSGSRSLPTQATAASTRNPLLQFSSLGVAQMFRTSVGGRSGKIGVIRSTGVSSVKLPPTLSLGTGLTPFNALGVQSASASQPGCRCPEPKRKKRSEPGCTNKLLSRSERDGIITTKRERTCPPSKPK